MTWLTTLQTILVVLATFASTAVPAIVGLVKAIKAHKAAVTAAEKEKATNDMFYHAQTCIEAAEKAYEGFDKVLKSQGDSAGSVKKKSVMTELQAYALQNGYDFDEEFWSQKIDSIVAMTKEVNAK